MTNAQPFYVTKYFKILFMILNAAIILGLISYILFLRSGGLTFSKKAPDVATQTYTEEEIAQAMERAGENMISIYGNLLPGSRAEFSDGNVMQFSADGVFSGYFNSENPSIEGTYIVTASDDEYLADVNIYNGESSDYVQYKLMYNENKDFMLYYPADNAYIALVY